MCLRTRQVVQSNSTKDHWYLRNLNIPCNIKSVVRRIKNTVGMIQSFEVVHDDMEANHLTDRIADIHPVQR